MEKLSRDCKCDVRILDRTWIIDRVYTNRRWEIVYQTLDIERPKSESAMLSGPLDGKRRMELAELDSLIVDPQRYVGSEYQLIEDCLQSALLARSIGSREWKWTVASTEPSVWRDHEVTTHSCSGSSTTAPGRRNGGSRTSRSSIVYTEAESLALSSTVWIWRNL